MPHWPKQWYGRDLPVGSTPWSRRSSQRIGAVGVAKAGIRTLAAATILAHGTDLQKEKFLRRILTGEDTWCQLFSEPGSGSDLAGAVDAGRVAAATMGGQRPEGLDHQRAQGALGPAAGAHRLGQAPKHQGLAYFILDMNQPGVEVHPLRQMNGHASFNQVFFTDAEVEPEILVAEVGDGWAVATTTLMHERRGADGLRTWAMALGRPGPHLRRGARRDRDRRWSPTSGIRSAPAASIWSWSAPRRPARSTIRWCARRSPSC